MSRETPYCKGSRTLCLGSACSQWVNHVTRKGAPTTLSGLAAVWGDAGEAGATLADDEEPTGEGLCADNLRADPWPDPANIGGA